MQLLVRNVDEAYVRGMHLIQQYGEVEPSRNGEVLVTPFPVMTEYSKPTERILFHRGRKANPWFHLMESMWMLLGRNDVSFVSTYNQRMLEYSDNGSTLRGAYGYRWRRYFGMDQVQGAIAALHREPYTRRVVIAMWDPGDTIWESKDKPCNTHIYLRVTRRALDMTVMCRSNDIIWGAYGANAVHFSILQEYIAANLGVDIGKLYQFSNNYHAYTDIFKKKWATLDYTGPDEWYTVAPEPIVTDPMRFMPELQRTIEWIEAYDYQTVWKPMKDSNPFMLTLRTMGEAWWHYKRGDLTSAILKAREIPALDWRLACTQWLGGKHE